MHICMYVRMFEYLHVCMHVSTQARMPIFGLYFGLYFCIYFNLYFCLYLRILLGTHAHVGLYFVVMLVYILWSIFVYILWADMLVCICLTLTRMSIFVYILVSVFDAFRHACLYLSILFARMSTCVDTCFQARMSILVSLLVYICVCVYIYITCI